MAGQGGVKPRWWQCGNAAFKKHQSERERERVQEECRAALNHIYMCGYLTCPLCDDKLHGAHVCRSAKL